MKTMFLLLETRSVLAEISAIKAILVHKVPLVEIIAPSKVTKVDSPADIRMIQAELAVLLKAVKDSWKNEKPISAAEGGDSHPNKFITLSSSESPW